MRDLKAPQDVLDRTEVDLALRPGDRALLLSVDGIEPGSGDRASGQPLQQAEVSVREAWGGRQVQDPPHVAARREATDDLVARVRRLDVRVAQRLAGQP